MRIDIQDAIIARNDASIIGQVAIRKLHHPVMLNVEGENSGMHELQELLEWMQRSERSTKKERQVRTRTVFLRGPGEPPDAANEQRHNVNFVTRSYSDGVSPGSSSGEEWAQEDEDEHRRRRKTRLDARGYYPNDSDDESNTWLGPIARRPFNVSHIEPVQLMDGDRAVGDWSATLGILLITNVRHDFPRRVETLLDMRADPLFCMADPPPGLVGFTALHYAARAQNLRMVKTMLHTIAAGASPPSKQQAPFGALPPDKRALLRRLVSAEAGPARQTPLHMALSRAADQITQFCNIVNMGVSPGKACKHFDCGGVNLIKAAIGDRIHVAPRGDEGLARLQESFFIGTAPTRVAGGTLALLRDEDAGEDDAEDAEYGEDGEDLAEFQVINGVQQSVLRLILRRSSSKRGPQHRNKDDRQVRHMVTADPSQMVATLLTYGAPVDVVDSNNDTPLSLTVRQKAQWSHTCAAMLLAHKASPDAVLRPGEDALYGPSRPPIMVAVERGGDRMVHLLLGAKADPNPGGMMAIPTPAQSGRYSQPTSTPTPIMIAASGGHDCIVMLLARRGACVEHTDGLGRDAFHYAALANRASTITVLGRVFPAFQPRNDDVNGETPLHLAVRLRAFGAVEALLEWRAKPDSPEDDETHCLAVLTHCGFTLVNDRGFTPVDLAASAGLLAFFMSAARQFGIDYHDATDRRLRRVTLGDIAGDALLRPQGWIRARLPPLHLAVCNGHTPIAKWLLGLPGADPNAPACMPTENPAPRPSSLPPMQEEPFDAVVPVNEQGHLLDVVSGYTPLHVAVACRHPREGMVRMLLEAKADPLAKDMRGSTPMDLLTKRDSRNLTRDIHGILIMLAPEAIHHPGHLPLSASVV